MSRRHTLNVPPAPFPRVRGEGWDEGRRAFLGRAASGFGALALGSLLDPRVANATGLHHPAKAKRVIWLYMAGGPSQLESFDYKPKLKELAGKPMPESFTRGQPIAQLQGKPLTVFEAQYPFERYGRSGQEICTLFPHIGSIADEICVVRSMTTEAINHDPAHTFMNTGSAIAGRPSMGSWLLYGLGNQAVDLPGFVVMVSTGKGGQMQPIAGRQWSSGFLPGRYQGIALQSQGEPVHHLSNPPGVSAENQRDVVDAVRRLNELRGEAVDDPEIATRINQYEMAFQMQTSVPRLMDLADESRETLELYGVTRLDGSFAANCLLARRMAERGVRFTQLYHRDWDHHSHLKRDMKVNAEEVDRASAALVLDLKRRGMLEDTIVVWGGEFGRTPMAQDNGRDHHIKGFSVWLAGGGFRAGHVHGKTDELGYHAVEDIVPVHDLHATMLHQLGVDHKRLTFRFQGRDFRLTDVSGNVVRKLLT